MTTKPTKPVRCAVYTRVSTDHGLEQDFNSLDAQREAAEAYIKSQAHANWILIKTAYDDGGFSGGNTERPALKRLLEDVKARKLDVIVVYKVDRLTRTLADFAKLVELFDAHEVSFVSVTQHFNTTNSMGRLTLNVLLSFAQFEREVTSERIRDKIAASKRKGLWVGGAIPIGYEVKDKTVRINEKEAKLVRHIFRRYSELASVNKLLVELKTQGVVNKKRTLKTGRTSGGIAFTRGPLYYLLRNRFYVGEIVYKSEILPGPQPPIIERKLFNKVQKQLRAGQNNATKTRTRTEALLAGLIFDDRGNRMYPSHMRKKGRRYRYYVSSPKVNGTRKASGNVARIPALEVEEVIVSALRKTIKTSHAVEADVVIRSHVKRIEVLQDSLLLSLKNSDSARSSRTPIRIAWKKPSCKPRREIVFKAAGHSHDIRPIRSETRAGVVAAVARGRSWLGELLSGTVQDVEVIATREKCTIRKVNMTISLAFVSPQLVEAAIRGTLPRRVGIRDLYDLPNDWTSQLTRLSVGAITDHA